MLTLTRLTALQQKLQRQQRFEFIRIQDQADNQAESFAEAELQSIDQTASDVDRNLRIITLLRMIDSKLDSISAHSVSDHRHHGIFAEVDAMFQEVKSLRSAANNTRTESARKVSA